MPKTEMVLPVPIAMTWKGTTNDGDQGNDTSGAEAILRSRVAWAKKETLDRGGNVQFPPPLTRRGDSHRRDTERRNRRPQ
jgi:hypothetical protein